MSTITSSFFEIPPTTSGKKPSAKVHNHPTKPEGYYDNNGKYVCTNKNGMKAWLQCAKKNGSCSGLTYHQGEKHLIFPDKKAEYGYSVRKWDNANMIRSMFNLKDGAIHECNPYISEKNVNEPLRTNNSENEKIIYFYEDGILP